MASYKNGKTPSIIIMGTGFSGLCIAIKLKEKLKLNSFTLYSMEEEVGGTWAVNNYPGVACDVPSHLYSFSFAPNSTWTQKFSSGNEIFTYIKGVARKYDLYKHIQFRTAVITCVWINSENRYKVGLENLNTGEKSTVYADIVVSGTGALRIPQIPEEYRSFEGPICHSARWDSEIELNNKTVAVVGTGASSVQIVPNIAPKVKQLYVIQRTPTWIVPRGNYTYGPWAKFFLNYVPFAQRIYRAYLFLFNELNFFGFMRDGSYMANMMEKAFKGMADTHLTQHVTNEEVRKRLTPSYSLGCKRMSVSDEYLATFNLSNVSLITGNITNVKGNTISTTEGDVKVDALILTTGFVIFDESLPLVGKSGRKLIDYWEDYPCSYLGITHPEMPNFYFMVGPHTGIGHNSLLFMIECQSDYIIEAIRATIQKDLASLVVREDVQHAFSKKLQKDLEKTVFTTGCKSWYQNKSGELYAVWSGNCVQYWRTAKFRMSDYVGTPHK